MTGTTSTRRRAREAVLRILYQAEITGEPIAEVTEQVVGSLEGVEDAIAYVVEVTGVVDDRREEIDALLVESSRNWSLERMAATDRNVLRAAVAELMVRRDVDARVVLDEAVSIAKRFGTDHSAGFVNGILDRLARQIRPGELET